jgi:hypothetical protein
MVLFFISFFIVSQSSWAVDLDLTNTTLGIWNDCFQTSYHTNIENQMDLWICWGNRESKLYFVPQKVAFVKTGILSEKILTNYQYLDLGGHKIN